MKSNFAPPLLCALGLVATPLSVAPSAAVPELNLDAYFKAAAARSEVVANQVELIRQAEERYQQANAARGPRVEGFAAYTREDAGGSASSATRQPVMGVGATQSLFRGFREIAALRQTEALIGARHHDYLHARVQLFKDVADNFYTILSLQRELENLKEQIEQNQSREKEIRARVRIGRSRASEVLTVQSATSTLRAEVEQLQGELRVAREVFAFLSGLDPTTPLADTDTPPAALPPLEQYLARVALRPDVQAERQRLTAARESVEIAKGARLPSVDLKGNYYLERPDNRSGVDWDVEVALTIPLYTGGGLQSQVREAASQQTQTELALSRVSRAAEQEIRSAYQSVLYRRARLEALEAATALARENYEAQTRDYRLGLVSNLDVLQALTALQQNQRALDRARYAMKLDYARLQAAAVERPVASPGGTP